MEFPSALRFRRAEQISYLAARLAWAEAGRCMFAAAMSDPWGGV